MYVTTQPAKTTGAAVLRAAMLPRMRTGLSGLGGPLTITIAHGELGGARRRLGFGGFAGATSLTFEQGVQAASDALDRLFDLASALYDRATDTVVRGEAEAAMAFTASAFRGLEKAIDRQDVAKLQDLQRAIDNITKNTREDLVDATIQRFILAVIAPPLATADPATIEQLKEQVRTAKPPGLDDKGLPILPWWVYAGAGLGALAVLGYFIRSIA